ncbi:MAG TPA: exodeoxyribonuclease VII large subunit [bacterium]|nr:exodeoxyribonuclease VII large subunit [bacterium]HPQ66180.1 exodeoxyribonuclease VII large subunit [bacterium]
MRVSSFSSQAVANSRPLTVSEVTASVKRLLESSFAMLSVEGEISNFRLPASGHAYFTIKDERAQLAAVMFRSALALLRFVPEDGLKVVVQGRLTVYGPRGQYQIQAVKMSPRGGGELQLALEQLKRRLEKEGLFREDHKRPLPPFPSAVGVITSPTGAAIKDILQVLGRRFRGLRVVINPVRVQGEGAAEDIARAIEEFNLRGGVDVLIVGRGGGSIEDLWAFNEERVARAIFRSAIPVVSAVGHEIDWTVADFVADVRAPTPSAAAELITREPGLLAGRIAESLNRLDRALAHSLGRSRSAVAAVLGGWAMRRPSRLAAEGAQRTDDLAARLERVTGNLLSGRRWKLEAVSRAAVFRDPSRLLAFRRRRAAESAQRLDRVTDLAVGSRRSRLGDVYLRLEALSPLAVLGRGYAVVFAADGTVVRTAGTLSPGEEVRTRVGAGEFVSVVTGVSGNELDSETAGT